MASEIEILKRKIEREKRARIEAEILLENKSREVYQANEQLKDINERLEDIVDERTERLRASQEEYYMLINNISDLICKTTLSGNITYINPITSQTLGYPKQELIDSHIFNYIDQKEKSIIIYKAFRNFIEGNCMFYTEVPVKTKTGQIIWLGLDVNFYSDVCCDCIRKHRYLLGKSVTKKSENCEFKEIIFVARNITEQKQTKELLQQQKLQLAKNLNQQIILSETAVELNTLKDFNEKIDSVLSQIGQHLDVSRVYIFKNSNDLKYSSNTFEWCNIDIEPQIDSLQKVPYELIPSWLSMLQNQGIVFSENIHELPQDLVVILEPQEIKSIIVLPIYISNKFYGFMGFDECKQVRNWSQSEIELLRALTNIVSNAIQRNIVEHELKKSEQENSAIIHSIPDFIIHHTENGELITFKNIDTDNSPLNIEKQNITNIKELFDADFTKEITLAINECIANENFKFNHLYQSKPTPRNFETRLVKINDNEILSIIRDVSEIKENEKQLEIAKEKAEQASKAKSEFLANVSHELRTPMNAIIGFSEVLMEKIKDPIHQNQIKTILSSGRSLLSLINDILDLSKIEADKLNIEMEPMQIEVVFNELKQVFAHKVKEKNLAFEIQLDPKLPRFIMMDEVRFYQIIYNLVGNAIKYTDKGYVNISTKVQYLSKNSFNLTIAVKDTGIGIPKNQKEIIFDAFTQQSGQTNRRYEGTGLGLSITRKLVEKFNGNIKLSTKVGEGSTFTVQLPKIKIARDYRSLETSNIAEDENITFEPSSILVVDDISYNIEIIKSMIDTTELKIHEVSCGEDALDFLQYHQPHIILMDLRMIGISGYNTTEIIKSNKTLNKIPVIALIDMASIDQLPEIMKLFDGFLQKPISKNDLISTLKKHLKYSTQTFTETIEPVIEEIPKLDREVIDSIKEELLPTWNDVKDDLIVFEIEAFVKKITNFNKNLKILKLNQYANNLQEALSSFNVDQIEKRLKQFPELIKQFENNI